MVALCERTPPPHTRDASEESEIVSYVRIECASFRRQLRYCSRAPVG